MCGPLCLSHVFDIRTYESHAVGWLPSVRTPTGQHGLLYEKQNRIKGLCVCVCVCVCREGQREMVTESASGGKRKRKNCSYSLCTELFW